MSSPEDLTLISSNNGFVNKVNFIDNEDRPILAVGLICLDMVVTCNSYPAEDSDQRCQNVQWRRGGNASNNCSVLSQLGAASEFLGTMGCDYVGQFLKKDLEENGIHFRHCRYIENEVNPTSCILINSQNGSRTILHSRRNFPELAYCDFIKIDLSTYKWIHFEGRNCNEVKDMINCIEEWRASNRCSLPVSVELEKSRPERMELLPYGDYVFVEKEFAKMCGYACMQTAVQGLVAKVKTGAVVICAWGEAGACAKRGPDGPIVSSQSFPPPRLVDTLGAGDTFVASTIYALAILRLNLQEAITFGCQLAGAKCGMHGFQGLRTVVSSLTY